ncbi:MAG TPA: hypothetical protein VF800_06010 [Telluria sp.]|jgi:hypothetical protein
MNNPADVKPNGSFADHLGQQSLASANAGATPVAAAGANSFTLALSNGGTTLGWLGKDSGGWAILVSDVSQAVVFEKYIDSNGTYYAVKGGGSYLSVSNQAYIGFYNWLGATTFSMKDNHLVSSYNGQKLSLYSNSNGYLYAWDAYTVLEVAQVAQ